MYSIFILTLNGEHFYVVTRFDRTMVDGITVRLHQEDFCQLLNIPPKLKYQEDGGPGIEDSMNRLLEIHLPADGRLGFIRMVLFNFLIGNCDAHAKNYAVLYHEGKPSLAPAYDLLSTMVYDTIAKRFAMSIGGETRMGMLRRAHFEQMAKSCGLKPKLVLTELDSMAKALPSMAQSLANELNVPYPSAVYSKCAWEVKKLCLQAMD